MRVSECCFPKLRRSSAAARRDIATSPYFEPARRTTSKSSLPDGLRSGATLQARVRKALWLELSAVRTNERTDAPAASAPNATRLPSFAQLFVEPIQTGEVVSVSEWRCLQKHSYETDACAAKQ